MADERLGSWSMTQLDPESTHSHHQHQKHPWTMDGEGEGSTSQLEQVGSPLWTRGSLSSGGGIWVCACGGGVFLQGM